MSTYWVDLSEKNGVITDTMWTAIKARCEGVILRFGYRGYGSGALKKDAQFDANLAKLKQFGLQKAVYFFSQAINYNEGAEEARLLISSGAMADMDGRIYIDTEMANAGNGRADKISSTDRTQAMIGFCSTIAAAGFKPGIYASTSWFSSHLVMSLLSQYKVWTADYRATNGYTSNCVMWQYNSTNRLGISGFGTHLDCNICYETYNKESPAPSNDTGSLKIGMSGEKVLSLQKDLKTLGYVITADGAFGPKTDEAVKSFQRSHNLTVDGIAGVKTMSALNAALKNVNSHGAFPTIVGFLRSGNTGSNVSNLQKVLTTLGFYKGSIDGKFGPKTEDSVKCAQKACKLTQDGICGPATIQALKKLW